MSTRSTLARLRRTRGLTQEKLALKSGVAQSRISEVESGTRALTVDAAIKTSKVLRVDPISLYLSQTIPALKAAVERGEESPTKAATVARSLVEVMESGGLTADQRTVVRNAVEQLVDLAESAAQKERPGTLGSLVRRRRRETTLPGSGAVAPPDPPSRDVEDEAQRYPFDTETDAQESSETYEELGRDALGRRKPDYIDLDADYFAESGTPEQRRRKRRAEEAATKSAPLLGDDLGRDAWGRQLNM